MNLKTAFATSWASFKHFIGRADAYITANGPKIQSEVATVSGIVVAVDPALAPIVTFADTLEESLMGEITAAFHTGAALVNTTDGTTAITLSAELSGILKHLAGTLKGHPAVTAAAMSTK